MEITISNLSIDSLIINVSGDEVMATLQEVLDVVTDISTKASALNSSIANLRTDIQMLKDQIAAGTPVTQQQLDDLFSSLTQDQSALQTAVDAAAQLDSETP